MKLIKKLISRYLFRQARNRLIAAIDSEIQDNESIDHGIFFIEMMDHLRRQCNTCRRFRDLHDITEIFSASGNTGWTYSDIEMILDEWLGE